MLVDGIEHTGITLQKIGIATMKRPKARPSRRFSLMFSQAALLALIPAMVCLLDVHESALAGCGSYGYWCEQTVCFSTEVSTDAGSSWNKGSASIYGPSGAQLHVTVRTTMTTNTDKIQGWSFGVRHSAATLDPLTNGGDFVMYSAESGAGAVTADFHHSQAWTCGFTQGVAIDGDGVGTYEMGPTNDLVMAEACYLVTIPNDYQVHYVTLQFLDDVGSPPVENIAVREGESLIPCFENLTLQIQRSESMSTPSYCPSSGTSVLLCE